VIGLGLRLAVAGGRAAITQLVMIAAAVAIGSCMLLTTLAVLHAVEVQNDRYAWLETGIVDPAQPVDDTVDALWWRLSGDVFDGELIGRVDLAPTGPDAPIPPGIPELPAAGEMYVSPALAELLGRTPAAQLADRFPATVVGTIGREALASPDSLIAIVGHEAADLATSDATLVREISTTGPDECGGSCAPFVGTKSAGMTLIISVAAAAVLLPVLVFIAGATRLSAARREQRYAAMRLVGATPRQIGAVASVEAALAASAGVVVGVGLFVALRPLLARLPFATERFFAGDLTLAPADVVLVGIGIPIAAAVAARVALRRVITSPLAVSRQATARPTRVWRVIPLFAGIAWLAYLAWFTDIGASHNTRIQAVAYLAGIVSIMIGLVVAGPWVTAVAARLTARRAARPAALIAARRLGDDPHTAFRAISAVVVAVFVASGAIGAITSVVANNGGAAGTSAEDRGTLVTDTVIGTDLAVPFDDQDRADLLAVPGVEGVTVLYRDPATSGPGPAGSSGDDFNEDPGGHPPRSQVGGQLLARCDQLDTTPALGRCADGASIARVELLLGGAIAEDQPSMADHTWPAADLTVEQLTSLPVALAAVATDGSSAAVEEARTVLQRAVPGDSRMAPQTVAEHRAFDARDLDRQRYLVNVVLLASLPIAGCSLAVNVAGSLAERRRSFSMLRLAGVNLSTLRRVIALEAIVPLLSGVVIAAGAGLAAAALFLRAQTDYGLQAPGLQYFVLLAAGVVTALAIIASTLPLLDRSTGPEGARF
jgi:FtsX-like permease family